MSLWKRICLGAAVVAGEAAVAAPAGGAAAPSGPAAFPNPDITYKTVHLVSTPFQKLRFATYEPNIFGFEHSLKMNEEYQLTNLEWAPYHEMIVHPAVTYLPNFAPRRVLIIGAGDGLTLKEVVKYESLERVDVMELEESVPILCNKHFGIDMNFDNPKVNWNFGDAAKTIESDKVLKEYDLIIVDTSEDLDTNSPIDSVDFLYTKMKSLLAPHGVFLKNGIPQLPKLSGAWKYTWAYDYFSYTWPVPGNKYSFILCSDEIDFANSQPDLAAFKTQVADPQLNLEFYQPLQHHFYMRDWKSLVHNGKPLLDDKPRPLTFGYDVVASGRSNHQDIEVVKFHKNVFNLDMGLKIDRVFDRHSILPAPFHEMLAHFPVGYLPGQKVERVLIVGGEDGRTLNEVLKWQSIVQVDVQGVDEVLHQVHQKYFNAKMHKEDERVNWYIEPLWPFITTKLRPLGAQYDLILVDKYNDEPHRMADKVVRDLLKPTGLLVASMEAMSSKIQNDILQVHHSWRSSLLIAFNSLTCPAASTCYIVMYSKSKRMEFSELVVDRAAMVEATKDFNLQYYQPEEHFRYYQNWREFLSDVEDLPAARNTAKVWQPHMAAELLKNQKKEL